jgi:hypothetical protein
MGMILVRSTLTLSVLVISTSLFCSSAIASCMTGCVVWMVTFTNKKILSSIDLILIGVQKIAEFHLKLCGVLLRQLFGVTFPKNLVGQFYELLVHGSSVLMKFENAPG